MMVELEVPTGETFKIMTPEGRKALRLHIANLLGWTNVRTEKVDYVLFVGDELWGTRPDGYEDKLPNWPQNTDDALGLLRNSWHLEVTGDKYDVWFGKLSAVIGWDKDAYENIERTFSIDGDGMPTMALVICTLFLMYDAAVKAHDVSRG